MAGLTAAEVRARKGGARLAMLTAYDYPTAVALDRCGLDLVLVGDSLGEVELGLASTKEVTLEMMAHHIGAVRRGLERTHLVGDMPLGSDDPPAKAAESARFLAAAGADSVKLEGPKIAAVEAIVAAGVPVMGHVGLLPQTATSYRRQGRTPEAAGRIVEDARRLEAAGCYAIVIEAVVPEVAEQVTAGCDVPTIGIAAGVATDGQVLVSTDLIGQLPQQPPFVTPKADVHGTVVTAGRAYVAAVRGAGLGEGPEAEDAEPSGSSAYTSR